MCCASYLLFESLHPKSSSPRPAESKFFSHIYLSNTMIQLKVDLVFSRTTFELGKGKWSPTMFLRDKIQLNANIFLKKT